MDLPKEYSELLGIFDNISIYSDSVIQAYFKVTKSHIDLAQSFEEARLKWKKSVQENEDLAKQLKEAHKTINDLHKSLQASRNFLDVEKQKTRLAVKERDQFARKLNLFSDILKNDKDIHENTRTKLISNLPDKEYEQLDTILETTDNIMSDLSYTRDEMDSSDISGSEERPEKRRFYEDVESTVTKRRKKSTRTVQKFDLGNGDNIEKVIATTTVTVDQNGPVSATSIVETVPSTSNGFASKMTKSESDESLDIKMFRNPSSDHLPCTPFGINSINTRPHRFYSKPMIKGETCNVCSRWIKFSTSGAKCKDCKSVCHIGCKDKVPLPCVPATTTPSHNNGAGTIADYTPKRGPMVPALVVHCIKEIEARGLTEVGLYRIPGSEKEVKALKEKFFKGRGVPNLSQVPDVHTICGCLKDFLRSLKEPLITQIRWDEFVRASKIPDEEDKKTRLFQIVSHLPQPNRDTLAYIILHLQKVAESPDCKMPLSNLSKMFGPTIIGYSKNEPGDIFAETNLGHNVMSDLISIPAEYWESFMKEEVQNENYNIQKTPSSNSLLNFFQTPGGKNVRSARKARYFETP